MRMVGRLWGNYWAGAWIAVAGLAVGAVTVPVARLLYSLGASGIRLDLIGWALGVFVTVLGVGVWAYRFHTEDKQSAPPSL